jgi:hypothetical protein
MPESYPLFQYINKALFSWRMNLCASGSKQLALILWLVAREGMLHNDAGWGAAMISLNALTTEMPEIASQNSAGIIAVL